MKIIALAYTEKAESDFERSTLRAFIAPSWGGNDIAEADLHISTYILSDYDKSLVCNSYAEAHKKAHLTQMSEEEYNSLYGQVVGNL